MTDNPLLTGEVITSDGRDAVVLHHMCHDNIIAAHVRTPDTDEWTVHSFYSLDGKGCSTQHSLIPRPAVHPNLTGTRTWTIDLYPCNETKHEAPVPYFGPRMKVTLTDGDPASAKVEVVLPKGEVA